MSALPRLTSLYRQPHAAGPILGILSAWLIALVICLCAQQAQVLGEHYEAAVFVGVMILAMATLGFGVIGFYHEKETPASLLAYHQGETEWHYDGRWVFWGIVVALIATARLGVPLLIYILNFP